MFCSTAFILVWIFLKHATFSFIYDCLSSFTKRSVAYKKFLVKAQNNYPRDAAELWLSAKWHDVTCGSRLLCMGESLSDVQVCCGCVIFFSVWSEHTHAPPTFNLTVGSQISSQIRWKYDSIQNFLNVLNFRGTRDLFKNKSVSFCEVFQ